MHPPAKLNPLCASVLMNMKPKKQEKQKKRQFQDYTAQHSYVSTSAICNCTYLGICQRIYILHVKALYICYDKNIYLLRCDYGTSEIGTGANSDRRIDDVNGDDPTLIP